MFVVLKLMYVKKDIQNDRIEWENYSIINN